MTSLREWGADRNRRVKAFARRQAPYLVLLAFLFAFLAVILFQRMVISIRPGELGVLYRRLGGGTQIDTVYREGLHVIWPFNEMFIYNVRKQQFSDTIDVLTVDGLTVTVKYSVRYYLERDTLPLLHQRVGPDFLAGLAVVLGVAAATTVIFQRLRQPVVLGYILAGLIVGPHVPVVSATGAGTRLPWLWTTGAWFRAGLRFGVRPGGLGRPRRQLRPSYRTTVLL